MKLNDTGPQVGKIQQILISQGFPINNLVPNVFNEDMLSAVKAFQACHVDIDGLPLVVDGEIGPRTLSALANPSGLAQSSNLGTLIHPQKLTVGREAALHFHEIERAAGVHEIPDGSNHGDGVDKYKVMPRQASWAWCLLYYLWLLRQAGNVIAIQLFRDRKDMASCHQFATWCKLKGLWYPANSTDPKAIIPGNGATIFHDASTGHKVMILAVSPDGQTFICGEGNSGNGVHNRTRRRREFVGFDNLWGPDEQPIGFERQEITGKSVKVSDR